MTKIALKVAYDGTRFSGSQIQVHDRTVEGDMLRALEKLRIVKDAGSADLSSAGRTDRGVHSVGQIMTFYTDSPEIALPRVINSVLPEDIRVWASAPVPNAFDPRRHAVSRCYRYYLAKNSYDISLMREAGNLFIGEHDFTNFSKRDRKNPQNTIRTVRTLNIRVTGEIIQIDIDANAFLWNMVRKIVRALMLVGAGKRPVEWVSRMLDPENYEEGLEPAPAHGLVFISVSYGANEPEWVTDNYAVEKLTDFYRDRTEYYRVMSTITHMFATDIVASEKTESEYDDQWYPFRH